MWLRRRGCSVKVRGSLKIRCFRQCRVNTERGSSCPYSGRGCDSQQGSSHREIGVTDGCLRPSSNVDAGSGNQVETGKGDHGTESLVLTPPITYGVNFFQCECLRQKGSKSNVSTFHELKKPVLTDPSRNPEKGDVVLILPEMCIERALTGEGNV
ncbi:hypothetical protein BDV41DRAFT_247309 [Aspergillus transmontanensis]|uniref:Uncharacterized protein n=1 Tax=Aspergillus transmontanensis TaxID=1034304 RepID=A0A5N6VZ13_9EURO|nr:hypothetical protein BDV41DRAFT_247309 [Aspergillus transmontanensis]